MGGAEAGGAVVQACATLLRPTLFDILLPWTSAYRVRVARTSIYLPSLHGT